VAFADFIRPQIKFDGLEPLIARMKQDEAQARAILAGLPAPAL
jgi:riboflavin kinase/FMN adenylyltransferase